MSEDQQDVVSSVFTSDTEDDGHENIPLSHFPTDHVFFGINHMLPRYVDLSAIQVNPMELMSLANSAGVGQIQINIGPINDEDLPVTSEVRDEEAPTNIRPLRRTSAVINIDTKKILEKLMKPESDESIHSPEVWAEEIDRRIKGAILSLGIRNLLTQADATRYILAELAALIFLILAESKTGMTESCSEGFVAIFNLVLISTYKNFFAALKGKEALIDSHPSLIYPAGIDFGNFAILITKLIFSNIITSTMETVHEHDEEELE